VTLQQPSSRFIARIRNASGARVVDRTAARHSDAGAIGRRCAHHAGPSRAVTEMNRCARRRGGAKLCATEDD
jgi:hypothetical protein